MTACEVIVLEKGTFKESKVFIGRENDNVLVEKAERDFSRRVKKLLPSVSDEELEDALDNGYFEDPEGNWAVFIQWPFVEEVR